MCVLCTANSKEYLCGDPRSPGMDGLVCRWMPFCQGNNRADQLEKKPQTSRGAQKEKGYNKRYQDTFSSVVSRWLWRTMCAGGVAVHWLATAHEVAQAAGSEQRGESY